jgi:hypothetical protein
VETVGQVQLVWLRVEVSTLTCDPVNMLQKQGTGKRNESRLKQNKGFYFVCHYPIDA